MKVLYLTLLIPILMSACAGSGLEKKSAVLKVEEMVVQTIEEDVSLLNVYLSTEDIADKRLREFAVNKGVIPADANYEYYQKNQMERNPVTIWLISSKEEKITTVNSIKRIFRLRGAIVSKPSENYVDEINKVLYLRIKNGKLDLVKQKGIVNLLKTIAILEGDYNEGALRTVVAKRWLGKENFRKFKTNFPVKYQAMLKADLASQKR